MLRQLCEFPLKLLHQAGQIGQIVVGKDDVVDPSFQFRFHFDKVPADQIVGCDAVVIEQGWEVGPLLGIDPDQDIAPVKIAMTQAAQRIGDHLIGGNTRLQFGVIEVETVDRIDEVAGTPRRTRHSPVGEHYGVRRAPKASSSAASGVFDRAVAC